MYILAGLKTGVLSGSPTCTPLLLGYPPPQEVEALIEGEKCDTSFAPSNTGGDTIRQKYYNTNNIDVSQLFFVISYICCEKIWISDMPLCFCLSDSKVAISHKGQFISIHEMPGMR